MIVRLFLAALLLVPGAAAARQVPASSEVEDVYSLTALGFTPFQHHREVIRYTFAAREGTAIVRHIVVQVAPAADGRSAKLVLVSARTVPGGAKPIDVRREETISLEEYRSLRTQLVRYASDLDMTEQEVSTETGRCDNPLAVRFDMKLGGETRMLLSRNADCNAEAAAYDAGDFLLVAAERILGVRIEGHRRPR